MTPVETPGPPVVPVAPLPGARVTEENSKGFPLWKNHRRGFFLNCK